MACTLEDLNTEGCTSGIGKLTNEIQLLQTIAQLLADQLLVIDPGADTSVEAIQERACESGIGKVTDQIQLEQLIAQLLCDQA